MMFSSCCQTVGNYRKQIFVALLCQIGQIAFGFAIGWSTPVMVTLTEDTDLLGDPSETQLSWLVSNIFVGALLGGLPLSYLANKIGRKRTLMIGAIFSSSSFLGLALVRNIYAAILFRTTMGVGAACAMIVNLVYLGEIASSEIRGAMLGTMAVFHGIGYVLVYTVGHYLPYDGLNYVGMGICLLYLAGMLYVPESPVYLIRKDRDEDAKDILYDLNREEDVKRMSEMKEDKTETKNVKWSNLVTVKCNRKAFIITAVLLTLQQLSGIGPLLMYTTTIFEKSGSSIKPFLATIIIGCVQLLSGFVIPLFVDRYGRKILLLVSTMASFLSLSILSVYLSLDHFENPIAQEIQWLPLVMAITHNVAYTSGFGVIPNTLAGEMFELSLRSIGTGVVIVISWLVGFGMTFAFGALIGSLGIWILFIFFAAMCGVAFLFTAIFVPETKGKSLIEIQRMLS